MEIKDFICKVVIGVESNKRYILLFEDATLTELFKSAYSTYCHTMGAYWEEYGYWFRRD